MADELIRIHGFGHTPRRGGVGVPLPAAPGRRFVVMDRRECRSTAAFSTEVSSHGYAAAYLGVQVGDAG